MARPEQEERVRAMLAKRREGDQSGVRVPLSGGPRQGPPSPSPRSEPCMRFYAVFQLHRGLQSHVGARGPDHVERLALMLLLVQMRAASASRRHSCWRRLQT